MNARARVSTAHATPANASTALATGSPLRPRQVVGLALALLAALASSGGNPAACGPFLPEALFTYTTHPDYPLDRFARGRLGLLQPTYARSYLTVAYRHMSGLAVKEDEAGALVEVWDARLGRVGLDAAGAASETATEAPPARAVSGINAWRAARRALGGLPDVHYATERAVPGVEYQWYANVSADAFALAAATLTARVEQFGKESAIVRDWVKTQDLVFSADQAVPASLMPLADSAPALARADRAYQLAAAHFYAGAFAQARERFQRIARDEASPWRASAPYLAARCLLRQATVGPTTPAEAQRALEQAIVELDAIAGDASAPAGLRQSSRGLRGWADNWRAVVITAQHKPDAINGAASTLLAAAPGPAIGPALDRFTRLLDRTPAPANEAAAVASHTIEEELVDWLSIFQSANARIYEARYQPGESAADARDAAAVKALGRWRQRKTLPWLVAVLTHARPATPGVEEAVKAAVAVDEASAAYVTLAYHRARLRLEADDLPGARALLDQAIAAGGDDRMPPSALNDLRTLRLRTARSLDELLADGAKPTLGTQIAGSDYELGSAPSPAGTPTSTAAPDTARVVGSRMFDADAAENLNRLPLSTQVDAAMSASLPVYLKRDLAVAAWTRAVLLADGAEGLRIAPPLRDLAPVLAADLDAYTTAPTPEARRIAGVWAILRHPGLSPIVRPGLGREDPLEARDALHDNWWCGPRMSSSDYTPDMFSTAPKWPGGEPAAFLDSSARAAAGSELERLKPASATWLARETMAWAQARPADARLPQALHLAVQASRFGCTDRATGQAVRAAFSLLHTRFPASPWAKKTRYWYK